MNIILFAVGILKHRIHDVVVRAAHIYQINTLVDLASAISMSELSAHPVLPRLVDSVIDSNCAAAGIRRPTRKPCDRGVEDIAAKVMWHEGHIIRAVVSSARRDVKKGV